MQDVIYSYAGRSRSGYVIERSAMGVIVNDREIGQNVIVSASDVRPEVEFEIRDREDRGIYVDRPTVAALRAMPQQLDMDGGLHDIAPVHERMRLFESAPQIAGQIALDTDSRIAP